MQLKQIPDKHTFLIEPAVVPMASLPPLGSQSFAFLFGIYICDLKLPATTYTHGKPLSAYRSG